MGSRVTSQSKQREIVPSFGFTGGFKQTCNGCKFRCNSAVISSSGSFVVKQLDLGENTFIAKVLVVLVAQGCE